MPEPYTLERIENWVSDFCTSYAIRDFPATLREHAQNILTRFMTAACDARGLEPDEIEEADVKTGLLGPVTKLAIPPAVRGDVPGLCGAFLGQLEAEGRLGGGRILGAYARALKGAHEEAASGKPKPIRRPGSPLGRNDPCPCGSGKKYKKCCMNE